MLGTLIFYHCQNFSHVLIEKNFRFLFCFDDLAIHSQPRPFFSFLHFENLEKHKGPRILKNMTFVIQLYTKNEREIVIFTSLDNSFCEIKQNS